MRWRPSSREPTCRHARTTLTNLLTRSFRSHRHSDIRSFVHTCLLFMNLLLHMLSIHSVDDTPPSLSHSLSASHANPPRSNYCIARLVLQDLSCAPSLHSLSPWTSQALYNRMSSWTMDKYNYSYYSGTIPSSLLSLFISFLFLSTLSFLLVVPPRLIASLHSGP